MQKIPTLFVRDENDRRYVTREVTPGCEWVLAGEGIATRKFDGTCVMFDGTRWWARREVKPGKQAPADFVPVEHDETTGKTFGWEPIEASGFAKFHADALDSMNDVEDWKPGTYELCGPKVQGNPEGFSMHVLVPHGEEMLAGIHLSFDGIRDAITSTSQYAGWEGIVWHHDDGRMAKLKKRDFPKGA